MKPKAVAICMQKAPDSQLGFGVFALYARHHAGSCGSVNDIHFVFSQNSVVS